LNLLRLLISAGHMPYGYVFAEAELEAKRTSFRSGGYKAVSASNGPFPVRTPPRAAAATCYPSTPVLSGSHSVEARHSKRDLQMWCPAWPDVPGPPEAGSHRPGCRDHPQGTCSPGRPPRLTRRIPISSAFASTDATPGGPKVSLTVPAVKPCALRNGASDFTLPFPRIRFFTMRSPARVIRPPNPVK